MILYVTSPPVFTNLGLHPSLSVPKASLVWGPRICIPNRFSSVGDAAGLGPIFENHCFMLEITQVSVIYVNLDAKMDSL